MKIQDNELTKAISITLRTGIVLAVSCGVLGCLFYLPTNGNAHVLFHDFQGPQIPFASLYRIRVMIVAPTSIAERGYGIAEVGVLVLMATPIMRVILSLVSFLREKDVFFAGITIVVLAALACSIVIR